ncbi:MAG: glycerophosphodiester phosphodiesterase [Planctomycetota bacterium]
MKPLGIGHRGAPRLALENTLASFEKALASPHVDAVELDVHSTQDGRAVVIHDDTLERTMKTRGFVSEKTAAELGALGAPLLDDVLDLVKARDKRVFVELKMQPRYYAALPETVLALVREKKAEERVVLISFDHRTIAALKKAAPGVACGALCGQRLHEPARYVKEFLGADWWLPGAIGEVDSLGFFAEKRELDRRSFDECRAAGVKSAVWTVNHPDMMRAMLALGADGVISDDLDLLALLR